MRILSTDRRNPDLTSGNKVFTHDDGDTLEPLKSMMESIATTWINLRLA